MKALIFTDRGEDILLIKKDAHGRLWFFENNRVFTKPNSLSEFETNLVYKFTTMDAPKMLLIDNEGLQKHSLGILDSAELEDLLNRCEIKYGGFLKSKGIEETPFIQGPYFSLQYDRYIFMERSLLKLFLMYYIKRYMVPNASAVLLTDIDRKLWLAAMEDVGNLEYGCGEHCTREGTIYSFRTKNFVKFFPDEYSLSDFKFSIQNNLEYVENKILFNNYENGIYDYKLMDLFGVKKVVVVIKRSRNDIQKSSR